MKCPQYYLTEMQEVILFYNGLDVPTRHILDLRDAVPTKPAADAKTVIQKMVEYSQNGTMEHLEEERRQSMEDTLSKFMSESTKRHEENSYLIKEIRALTDAAIRNQGASIKTLEIKIGQMSKVLQERGFGSLPSSTETNPRDQVRLILTIIEADSNLIRQEGNYEPKFTEAYRASHINNTIPKKEKDPESFTLPYFINNACFDNVLVDLGASVSVMPLLTYLNLGLGELAYTKLTVELADRTMKYKKGIAENVLVGISKFTFPVDFIILDMPEDIKVPLILGRPFLSTACAKIDVYKIKITLRVGEEKIIFKSVKPASSIIKRVYMICLRERMELDLEARLIGETLVLNRSLNPFLEDYIELNDLNEPFELRRNRGDDLLPTIEEGALMNVPIFVGTFSIMTDFAVLEDMNAYLDEGMGDVIFGEPFLREVGIKTKRFEGRIAIYNGNDKLTYQMVRSHSMFKNHTNEQCNKIPPLLKVLKIENNAKTVRSMARGSILARAPEPTFVPVVCHLATYEWRIWNLCAVILGSVPKAPII
ncbi:hypothetical protein Tco_0318347 [Tanacetum coccineum]